MKHDKEFFDEIFSLFTEALKKEKAPLPAVSIIAEEDSSPYRILTSTILSLRTRDDVTLSSSLSLFRLASSFEELKTKEIAEIESAIKPSGFYKRKAIQLKRIAEIVVDEWNGIIPDDLEKLLTLPGVGIKTASLVLNLSFNKEAICVDCHVHEITNRLGIVKTKTPEETERELRKILPLEYWISLNELLVRYGQYICTPISPYCSKCPKSTTCPKNNVERSR